MGVNPLIPRPYHFNMTSFAERITWYGRHIGVTGWCAWAKEGPAWAACIAGAPDVGSHATYIPRLQIMYTQKETQNWGRKKKATRQPDPSLGKRGALAFYRTTAWRQWSSERAPRTCRGDSLWLTQRRENSLHPMKTICRSRPHRIFLTLPSQSTVRQDIIGLSAAADLYATAPC